MATSRKSQFKRKEEGEKRTVRIPVMVRPDEAAQIRESAAHRVMDVAEFMRRAALGRRADVAFDVEIVLALSDITRQIRAMHAALVQASVLPPEPEMLALIQEARAAMLRIER